MEKIIRCSLVITFATFTLYTGYWGISLVFSLLALLGVLYYRTRLLVLFIPLFLALTAFVAHSWFFLSIFLGSIYIARIIKRDTLFNHSKLGYFFSVIFLLALLKTPEYSIIPLLVASVSFPVYNFSFSYTQKVNKWIALSVLFFILFGVGSLFFVGNQPVRRAYLEHGVWANSQEPYSINNLTNKGAYSYSEFVKAFSAKVITNTNHLKKYNELWIVTPTHPFTATSISQIKEWIENGGHLILVTDHTDLYGHARVANQLAKEFGVEIHYSATFDAKNKNLFRNFLGEKSPIKTGTSMEGAGLFPVLTAWLWEEKAHYSQSNFFGPLAVSGNNSYGVKLLCGQKKVGKGVVTFLQDSTFFSNFALFQPHTLNFLSTLSTHLNWSLLFFFLPFLWLFLLVALFFQIEQYTVVWVLLLLGLIKMPKQSTLNLGKNVQIWSGNENFVLENGCPFSGISTAYSLASLSNHKPLWIDNPSLKTENVIWVDSIAPPNPEWRWVKVKDLHINRVFEKTDLFDSLYVKMSISSAFLPIKNEVSYKKIEINGLFNDVVMNDWWYNDGISSLRKERIVAWLDWLNGNSRISISNRKVSQFTKDKHLGILYLKDKEPQFINLPLPIENQEEVYLGCGLVATVLRKNGKISLIGRKNQSENWYAPEIWVIDYQ